MINMEAIREKRDLRLKKIEQYAQSNNVDALSAAMFIDFNAPLTTNRKMLSSVGYEVNTVTEDNYLAIIASLESIGVHVICDNVPIHSIISKLTAALDEEINECWGGQDMQEYLDFT